MIDEKRWKIMFRKYALLASIEQRIQNK